MDTRTVVICIDQAGKLVAASNDSHPNSEGMSFALRPQQGQTLFELNVPADVTRLHPDAFATEVMKLHAIPGVSKPHTSGAPGAKPRR